MKSEKVGLALIMLIITWFNMNTIMAQESAILDDFNVFENDGKIYLKWTISSGSTCDGTKIFRSVDQVHFDQIGEILGVCGSVSFPVGYEFVDEKPVKNQRNYYRLELGRSGFSDIASIETFDLDERGYQVRPNPANTETTIYFGNDRQEKYLLGLYRLDGVLVHTSYTTDSFIKIYTANLSAGLYIFAISKDGNTPLVKGKVIIRH